MRGHRIDGNRVARTASLSNPANGGGKVVTLHEPGLGCAPTNGRACVEGPWDPEPPRWYAEVEVVEGRVVKVR